MLLPHSIFSCVLGHVRGTGSLQGPSWSSREGRDFSESSREDQDKLSGSNLLSGVQLRTMECEPMGNLCPSSSGPAGLRLAVLRTRESDRGAEGSPSVLDALALTAAFVAVITH